MTGEERESGLGANAGGRGGSGGQGSGPGRPGSEQQRDGDAASGRSPSWRRAVLSFLFLAAVLVGIIATVAHFRSPSRHGAASAPTPISTSSLDGDKQQAAAAGGGAGGGAATTSVTPVPVQQQQQQQQASSSATTKAPTASKPAMPTFGENILKNSAGAAAISEQLLQAIEENPKLMDVVDDKAFMRDVLPEDICYPKDGPELEDVIENSDCSYIVLEPSNNTPDNPYRLARQVNVTRSITIQGDSLDLPFIDCFDAVRCFRVEAGAYFTLRYVAINQGTGEYREAIPFFEGIPTTPTGLVLESRGGSVLFDPGSLGGMFVGVLFIDDMSGAEEMELIIELNLNLVSVRIYGGFVFIAGGDLQFIGCMFYDYEVIATNDRIYLGGDVLMLAGEMSFTGCVWIYTTWFANENGAGFNIAMLDGVSAYTFCQFTEFNLFLTTNGVGQAYMVVGGVQVMTGVDLTYFTVGELFSGTGELTVFGGVQIAVGMAIQDFYAMMVDFGAGLDYCVMGGVLVHVGTSLNQFTGPTNSGMVGGYTYLGGGTYAATAAPIYVVVSTASEFGGGSVAFVGGGILTMIASPVVDVSGIGLGFFAGEYHYVGEGFMVWLFCPTVVFTAIDYFQGYGGFVFVGLGAAVLGYSETIQHYFITDEGRDFWIMGTCEPLPDTWAPQAPFLVTMNYAGPNSEGFRRCTNRTYPEGAFDGGGGGGGGVRFLEAAAAAPAVAEQQEDGEKNGRWTLGSLKRQVGFMLLNSSSSRLDLQNAAKLQEIRSYGVPEEAIKAAGILDKAMAALGADDGEPREKRGPKPLSLWVNSPVDGYCGICGIEDVAGPGMDSCKYSESCNGFEGANKFQDLLDWAKVEYKERFVIIGTMESTTRSNVSTDAYPKYTDGGAAAAGNATAFLRNEQLQDALKASVLDLVPGVADDPDDLQVAVWSTAPDPLFADLFPEAGKPSEHADGVFDTTHRHKVAVVTTSRADADAVLSALKHGPEGAAAAARRRRAQAAAGGAASGSSLEQLQQLQKEAAAAGADVGASQPGMEGDGAELARRLTEGFKASLREQAGVELGHVGLAYARALYVPPYNSEALTQRDPKLNLGPFTVVLVDPEMPAVPVKHVEYKKPYRIHVEQFPPNAQLHLQIVGAPETAQALSGVGTMPTFKRTIAGSATGTDAFASDASGGVDLDYRFRFVDAPAGDYYLRVTDVATGMSGQSQLFLLSTQARRRKLYGPIMRI